METLLRAGLGNAVAATLLALLVAGLGGSFRRAPALRHVLWLLVLLKLVTPPMGWVPVAWPVVPIEVEPPRVPAPEDAGGRDEEAAAIEAVEMIEAIVPEDIPAPRHLPASWTWRHAVAVAWLVGSALTFAVAFARVRRFRRVLCLARPVPDEARGQVEALARRLGLARAPRLWGVPGAVSPMLWSFGGPPRLIVPEALWAGLDGVQRATLLAHELAHLRRRDHWVRGLELLVTGLFWWLPTAWLARRALREAEEQCCDAWVVWALPDASRTYAETLLQTVDFLSGAGPAVPVAASGLGHLHHLKRRLIMIMQGTTPRTLGRAGALVVLGLSAALLPFSPTWADPPGSDDLGVVVIEQRTEDPEPATKRDEGDAKKPEGADPIERARRVLLRERGYVARRAFEVDPDRPEEVAKLIDDLKMRLKELGDPKTDPAEGARREEIKAIVRKLEERVRKQAEDRGTTQQERAVKETTVRELKGDVLEARAEIEKAHAEIRALTAKVQEKHKELAEAQSALNRAISQLNKVGNVRTRAVIEREDVIGKDRGDVEYRVQGRLLRVPELPRTPAVDVRPFVRSTRVAPNANQDARIEALEKRLDQLLDEVKGLKKEKEKDEGKAPKKEKADNEKNPPGSFPDGPRTR